MVVYEEEKSKQRESTEGTALVRGARSKEPFVGVV